MRATRGTTFAMLLVLGAALGLGAGGDDDAGERTPTPYPSEIAWEDVPDLLSTGEVESVFATHALNVTFQMKDGSNIDARIAWTELGINDIFQLVDECGDPCADLILATE